MIRMTALTAARLVLGLAAAAFFGRAGAAHAQKLRDDNPYHLRADARLGAQLNVDADEPKFSHVIAELRTATGLEIAVAQNLEYHDPDFGYVQPSEKGYFAWQLMELLARKDLDDARWVKTEGGYRLEGVSRALRPPPPHNFRWLWALIAASVVLAVGGGFAFYRRRRKTITV